VRAVRSWPGNQHEQTRLRYDRKLVRQIGPTYPSADMPCESANPPAMQMRSDLDDPPPLLNWPCPSRPFLGVGSAPMGEDGRSLEPTESHGPSLTDRLALQDIDEAAN
jgi:hypothetical protein